MDVIAALDVDPEKLEKLQLERPEFIYLLQNLKHKLLTNLPDDQQQQNNNTASNGPN